MRKEFLQQENENTRKYLTRAARIYDSIMNGTPLEDGIVLRDTMDDVEQAEFKDYLMTIMNPIIVRVVECEGRAAHLTFQVEDILLSRVYEMVLKDFGKFNNYKEDSKEEYTLASFIKGRIGDVIRNSVSEDQGIGVNRSRQRNYVCRVRTAIANEKQIEEEQITVDEICERINAENKRKNARNISKKLVMELLAFEKGFVSTSEMEENGEQLGQLQSGLVTEFDSEMDFDTKEILDEAFKSFSGLDYYILMKEYGMFGEQIRNQEMCDFVVTSLFQKLLIEDETIRSKADPVKTAYNKKNKIKKALASLNGKVNMSDLIGTIETYVEDKLKSYIK